ncbi:hypothetical protein PAMC26510_28635 [Caballeronia sordidicola]|uniref:Uncharacterized protein n=1 Tax=Caballeronia sordidicola TaxID=196367 RepID=A0A242MCN0_CABSO|nr:hypothetical protein PAMC26510_28635 [Caballeronia sordidicola]
MGEAAALDQGWQARERAVFVTLFRHFLVSAIFNESGIVDGSRRVRRCGA